MSTLEKEMLPIGSVVKAGGQTVLLTGVQKAEINGTLTAGYFCVPWPYGYLGEESLYFIRRGDISEVISRGYCDGEGKEFWNYVTEYADSLEAMEPGQALLLEQILQEIREKAEEDGGEKQ